MYTRVLFRVAEVVIWVFVGVFMGFAFGLGAWGFEAQDTTGLYWTWFVVPPVITALIVLPGWVTIKLKPLRVKS